MTGYLGDRFAACRPGDYTVEEAGGTFIIGRVMPTSTGQRSWSHVATVDTKERAVQLAKTLAADHETRALYANGTATFSLWA